MVLRIWWIILLFCCNLCTIVAGDLTGNYLKSKPKGNSLDKSRWEKLKEDYKYKTSKQKESSDAKQEGVKSPPFNSGGIGWVQWLLYAGVFLLLLTILYLLWRYGYHGGSDLKEQKKGFDIDDEPDDISDLEIDSMLAEALRNRNYRQAARLRFLLILQLLNNKQWIQWRKDSTNSRYLNQLQHTEIYPLFRQLCLVYETVWYGDYMMDEAGYMRFNEKSNTIGVVIKEAVYV